MTPQPLRLVLQESERLLREAGVPSPRVDAELLAAHLLRVERWRLPLIPQIDEPALAQLRHLVRRRAKREPLQHLTGEAAMGGITVAVGPGVFVPRPETELLLAWGLAELEGKQAPLVVDLCTGSGILALAVANARPDATVHAVEREPSALAWARRNANDRAAAGDTPITLHSGDVTLPETLADLDDTADLVLCNPPYVPTGTPVPPEVADHDPAAAVFGGPDGLATIRPLIFTAARLLKPGGAVAIEHDETHAEAVAALLAARAAILTGVEDHADLAGRPRFTTARRLSSP